MEKKEHFTDPARFLKWVQDNCKHKITLLGNKGCEFWITYEEESEAILISEEPFILEARKIWNNENDKQRKLHAVKHLMAHGWGMRQSKEYGDKHFEIPLGSKIK